MGTGRGWVAVLLMIGLFNPALAGRVAAAGAGSLDKMSGWYPAGGQVAVTAAAGPYSDFAGWAGDTNGCAVAGARIAVPVSGPRSLTAVFTLQRTREHGVPKDWLAANGVTNFEAEVDLDPDRDGKPTWAEYLAGTDPNDSGSVFGVKSVQIVGSQLRVVWLGKPPESVASRFVMYKCVDLAKNVWVAVDTNIVIDASGTNAWATPYSGGGSGGVVFYKPAFVLK